MRSRPTTPTVHKPQAARPRWQRRKEARPSEILSAALDVFVEKGYAAARCEDVASRAGVTKGTMYLYFESKEALFKAVVRESVIPYLERAEQLLEAFEGSTPDLFRNLVRGWWGVMGESSASGLPKLMMAEAANFPELARFYVEEVVQRGHRVVERTLRRGIERGEFRDFDVAHGVRLVIAPLLVGSLWRHSFHLCMPDALDARKIIELHIETFLRGIERTPRAEDPRA